MSLMARIRRCKAQLEWLHEKGPLRLCELQLKALEQKAGVEARLKANPRNENARRMATMLGLALPSLPKPPPDPPVRPPPMPVVQREPPPTPVVVAPPAAPPPPKPKPPPEPSYDIPEHMQIRPVHWRERNASDVDDWDDEDSPGYGQCLTEYDVLAEEDG